MNTYYLQNGKYILLLRFTENNIEVERYRLEPVADGEYHFNQIFSAHVNPKSPEQNDIRLDLLITMVRQFSNLIDSYVVNLILKHQIHPWGQKETDE